MGYEWSGWGIGMMASMWILWIATLALVVWLTVTLTRPGGRDRGAVHILEERLARGEIDMDEFRARKTAIEAGR